MPLAGSGAVSGSLLLRHRSRQAALVLLTSLSLLWPVGAGAADSEEPAPDPRVRIALDGLRQFGAGYFEVLDVKPLRARDEDFLDGQKYARHIRMVEIEANIRYTRTLMVPTREELHAAVGAPGWTLEQSLADLDRLLCLGSGEHPEGSSQVLHVDVALGRGASGWYFRTLQPIGPVVESAPPP